MPGLALGDVLVVQALRKGDEAVRLSAGGRCGCGRGEGGGLLGLRLPSAAGLDLGGLRVLLRLGDPRLRLLLGLLRTGLDDAHALLGRTLGLLRTAVDLGDPGLGVAIGPGDGALGLRAGLLPLLGRTEPRLELLHPGLGRLSAALGGVRAADRVIDGPLTVGESLLGLGPAGALLVEHTAEVVELGLQVGVRLAEGVELAGVGDGGCGGNGTGGPTPSGARSELVALLHHPTHLGDDLVEEVVDLALVVPATELGLGEGLVEDILGRQRHVVSSRLRWDGPSRWGPEIGDAGVVRTNIRSSGQPGDGRAARRVTDRRGTTARTSGARSSGRAGRNRSAGAG